MSDLMAWPASYAICSLKVTPSKWGVRSSQAGHPFLLLSWAWTREYPLVPLVYWTMREYKSPLLLVNAAPLWTVQEIRRSILLLYGALKSTTGASITRYISGILFLPIIQLSDSVRAVLNSIHFIAVNFDTVTSPSHFVAVSAWVASRYSFRIAVMSSMVNAAMSLAV